MAATAHEKFADVLHAIESEELNRDASIRESTLREARKVIQNALDGNRYSSPMLKNFTRIKPNFDSPIAKLDVLSLHQNVRPDTSNN